MSIDAPLRSRDCAGRSSNFERVKDSLAGAPVQAILKGREPKETERPFLRVPERGKIGSAKYRRQLLELARSFAEAAPSSKNDTGA
jgi:hypothetical protein